MGKKRMPKKDGSGKPSSNQASVSKFLEPSAKRPLMAKRTPSAKQPPPLAVRSSVSKTVLAAETMSAPQASLAAKPVLMARRSKRTPGLFRPQDLQASTRCQSIESPGDNSSSRPSTAQDEDEPDIRVLQPRSLKKDKVPKRIVISDDSDDESLVSPAKRRRLVRGVNVVTSSVNSDEEEDEETRITPRSQRKASRRKSEREKALELLRRKKRGEAINKEDLTSSEDERMKGIYDDDSDPSIVALQDFPDDDEGVPDGEDTLSPPKKSTPKNKIKWHDSGSPESNEESEDNIDDFVVDDGPLGAPSELFDIPLEFTARKHLPAKENFRLVIKYLVTFRLDAANPYMKDEQYANAWDRLNDYVSGLASSKFESSVWRPKFIKTLHARPVFGQTELISGSSVSATTCEACGRSNHYAKLVVTLGGKPYHKKFTHREFLEEVWFDDDSSSDVDVDESENEIEPENKVWLLGTTCGSKAETVHQLVHWKYALLNWVNDRLENEGYMTPSRLLERDKMSRKKKVQLIDDVMSKWDLDGTIKDLFRDFNTHVDIAANQDVDKIGRRRDRGR